MSNQATIKDALVGKIARQIISGQLSPGDRLPAERELAEQEGISRSAVHLAMVDLERMRFIETNARHGTYVCDFIQKGNIETLNLLIQLDDETLSKDRVRDMLDMRLAIEGKALELFLQKGKDEDFDTLQNDIDSAKEIAADAGNDDRVLAASFFDFHHDICILSGNFILPMLFNTFEYVTLIYWQFAIRYFGRTECIEILESFMRLMKTKDFARCHTYLKQELEVFLEHFEEDK